MSWHLGPLASFDTETTGVDVENDRIVTAALVLLNGRQAPQTHGWLANPEIDIPAAATKVHGISTAHAREHGRPAAEVVALISALLAEQVSASVPLVIMNARYDLTLLDRELARHGLPSLAEQAGREPLVIDPLVLDKRAERYRQGKRTLTDLAKHYGVQLGADAHTAAADALAAARITYVIATRYPHVQQLEVERLHTMQIDWAAEQAKSLQEHFRKKDPTAVVESAWPMIPRQQVAR